VPPGTAGLFDDSLGIGGRKALAAHPAGAFNDRADLVPASPIVPDPRNEPTREVVGTRRANLSGMAFNLAATPYPKVKLLPVLSPAPALPWMQGAHGWLLFYFV
jgi:hypothetical protein